MWANFCWDEGNFFFFWKNEIQNGRLKKRSFFKIANSQYFFVKISWSSPWVSRIHWCEGHWYGSTYMAVRLSDISSKTGQKCIFCVFGPFWAYDGQPHGHIGWAIPKKWQSLKAKVPSSFLTFSLKLVIETEFLHFCVWKLLFFEYFILKLLIMER